MLKVAVALFVFLGVFVVMVLAIIGARYLAKDFGCSSYIWNSQIGVVLVALAPGNAPRRAAHSLRGPFLPLTPR